MNTPNHSKHHTNYTTDLDAWPGDTVTMHGIVYRMSAAGTWEDTGRVFTADIALDKRWSCSGRRAA